MTWGRGRRLATIAVVAAVVLAVAVTVGYALIGRHAPAPSPTPAPRGRPSPSARPSAAPSRPAPRQGSPAGGTGSRGGSGGDPLASAQQQVNNAQLALLQAEQRLAGTVLTAPIAGKVTSVGGTVGSQEKPGGTGFIVLGDVQDTEVKAQFSEADVAHLAVGQVATITIPDRKS